MWIALVLIGFIIPVIYIVLKEWGFKKLREMREGGGSAKKKAVKPVTLIKVTAVAAAMTAPVLYFSNIPFSFYSPADSAVKVAFKHVGKRMVDCDESDLIKKEGERYRRELKEDSRVRMNIAKLSGCPRERFPVVVEVSMDGKKLLDKSYSPTGIKKDMASYVYDEFIVPGGAHSFSVKLYDNGDRTRPGYTLERTVDIAPGGIRVIWFDDKNERLDIE